MNFVIDWNFQKSYSVDTVVGLFFTSGVYQEMLSFQWKHFSPIESAYLTAKMQILTFSLLKECHVWIQQELVSVSQCVLD